jgi:hypothetical protein
MNIIEIKEQTEDLKPKINLWEVMNYDGQMQGSGVLNAKEYENIEVIAKEYGKNNMSLFFCYQTGKRKEGFFYTGVIL